MIFCGTFCKIIHVNYNSGYDVIKYKKIENKFKIFISIFLIFFTNKRFV